MFDRYSIPRENLLNRTGDVTPDGHYTTPIKDPNKRFGRSLLHWPLALTQLQLLFAGLLKWSSLVKYLEPSTLLAVNYEALT